ncbi:MAG: primosomal protein N' [Alphaproteobacteria bacterium]|nr:primosomal protein N' [Alphaproteobacteria bacterium]
MADRAASSLASAAESGAAGPESRVQVLLPLPLAGAYDYRVPAGNAAQPGDFVLVPLGRRHEIGVVWDPPADGPAAIDAARLKDIEHRFDLARLPDVARRFVDWVASYTLAPPGAVLRMAMSVSAVFEAPPRPVVAYRRAGESVPEGVKLTPQRRRVLDLAASGPPLPAANLAREAGVGTGVVRALAESGLLVPVALQTDVLPIQPDGAKPGPKLSADQEAAADELRERVAARGYSATLLDGVTGSGKTEVYFEAIGAALRQGRQALVLLPEIALTAAWLDRFAQRFGAMPAEWHSELSSKRRRQTWRDVAAGNAKVVVGARSALFLPYPDLGLIVVDEEHDAAFKQEDGVIYHARDMAVVRAHLGQIPIVLSSATPSLESVVNADSGRYRRLNLPARHGGAALPEIAAIDLRRDKPPRQRWLSPTLRQALGDTLAQGEQAMLFLNRRGYAPLTLCRACGHRLQCPSCSAWLVEHRLVGRLQCHHCGYATRLPEKCPACGAEGEMAACGPGVERLSEEVAELFPQARASVMASDTITGPRAAAEFVRAGEAHELDIVIGTQIVAKGHHFPMLTLVGVVDGDLGLAGGDLRAAERSFQLLYQVAGRAGRADRPGRVLIQTADPDHAVMRALIAGDRDGFLAAEAEQRRRAGMPPFGRLAALIVSSGDAAHADATARALARTAPRVAGVEVLGPAPAPLSLLRGRHRRRLLMKARRGIDVQFLLRDWLARVPLAGDIRVQVDVDPYSFM